MQRSRRRELCGMNGDLELKKKCVKLTICQTIQSTDYQKVLITSKIKSTVG